MVNHNLRRAVHLALTTGAATSVMCSGVAVAQDQDQADEADVATVIVTGSRIHNKDYEATSPVITLSDDLLKKSGSVQIDSFLNQLPQLVPSVTTTSNNPGNGGQANIDVRGFGIQRTLVLMDGTRLVPSNVGGEIDLNTIPAALIESIEIATGGSSATYGSDAISGVVNIRMKKNFSGVSLDTSYGKTGESDGKQLAVSLVVGGNFAEDRGNAVLALAYDDRNGILQGDREFSQVGLGPDLAPLGSGTPGDGRYDRSLANLPTQAGMDALFAGYGVPAGTVTNDQNLGFNSNGTAFATAPTANYLGDTSDPGFNPANYTYNFAPINYLQLPLTRRQVAGFGNYKIAEWTGGNVETYARLMYTTYTADAQLAATPITGMTVPSTNPNIPADFAAMLATRPTPDADFTFRKRIVEAGPRISENNYDVVQGMFGLRGELSLADRPWNWDVYGSWGQLQLAELQAGNISFSRINGLLNGEDLATCTSAEFDPFGLGTMSANCAQAISIKTTNVTQIEQENFVGDMTGDLFNLPAGAVKLDFGYEYRSQHANFRPDEFLASGDVVGFNAQQPVSGGYNVSEIFTEVSIPILKDAPMAKALDIEFGGRYSDYNLSGGATTYKAAFNWQPIDQLKFRGSFNHAIRAASIQELFLPPQENFPGYNDPCDFDSPQRAGANAAQVAALCQAQGIPAASLPTFNQANAQVRAIQGGNPDLDPESADTYTFGLVWSPDFGETRARASVDYWQYKIEDFIGSVTSDSSISRCFNDVNANPTFDPNNSWCNLFFRDGSGEIQDVQETNQNLSALKADGIDLQFDLGVPLGDNWGRLNTNLLVTKLLKWDFQEDAVSPFGHFAGTITTQLGEAYPKWKAVLNLDWKYRDFDFGWNIRYVGSMTVVNNDALGTPVTTGVIPSVSSFVYHRATAGWKATDKITLNLGIDNVFDKIPPIYTDDAQAGVQANTDPSTYDVLGRRFFGSVIVKF